MFCFNTSLFEAMCPFTGSLNFESSQGQREEVAWVGLISSWMEQEEGEEEEKTVKVPGP